MLTSAGLLESKRYNSPFLGDSLEPFLGDSRENFLGDSLEPLLGDSGITDAGISKFY